MTGAGRLFIFLYTDEDVTDRLASLLRERGDEAESASEPCAGIILSRQFSNRQTGELLRQVCRLIDSVSADEIRNTVRNLQEPQEHTG